MTSTEPIPPAALRQLPNALSGARLVLALAFPFVEERWWLALVVIVALSDWLDGQIARRFGLVSWTGELLDGLADKAFCLSALLTLMLHDRLPAQWLPWLFVRDVAVASGVAVSLARRDGEAFRNMDSRLLGKLTTAIIFAYLASLLIWPDAEGLHERLFLAAAITNVAAGIDYVRTRYRGIVHGARPTAPDSTR